MNSQKVRIQNVFSCLLMRGVAFLSFFFLPTIITLMAFFSNLPIWVVGSCAFFFGAIKEKTFWVAILRELRIELCEWKLISLVWRSELFLYSAVRFEGNLFFNC